MRDFELEQSHLSDSVPAGQRAEGFITIDGVEMYCIPRYDRMPLFLMTMASDSDLWMYISSYGALTAGRSDEEHSLFPYETEDRLHHAHGVTGPITLIRATISGEPPILWEPFNHRAPAGPVQRNLFKSILGERIIFEETHPQLGLTLRSQWTSNDEFGFVRTVSLIYSEKAESIKIELLDGLLNIMPPGVSLNMQQGASCLADAYKRSELDLQTQLAIYSLSSVIHDRPEPAEYLRANVVWTRGLSRCQIHLSENQVDVFRNRGSLSHETEINGQRGAFLVTSSLTLSPRQTVQWDIVADVDRDHLEIEKLRRVLLHEPEVRETVAQSTREARENLLRSVASADALQSTADIRVSSHHAANVLFNNMRGGVPADQYAVSIADFLRFVQIRNVAVLRKHAKFFASLNEPLTLSDLLQRSEQTGDANLLRLAYEYLPLTFSRRHGDPSRPWNRFKIHVKNHDGSRAISYQGNWRDIFQNWESLSFSYPTLIENFLAKFVNASTIDGFNPYRITYDGIDWELHNPEDPWGNIGYWGDHQIIYLLKFLEASQGHHPGTLETLLSQPIFAYANVPYRIKPYDQIVADPHNTIIFDKQIDRDIAERAEKFGSDAKLLFDSSGKIYHANLCEKLLVPLLSKVCNFVIGGGIWMNTQRPEWNDANNALAGNGLSVVTLCYLRRYVQFMLDLLEPLFEEPVELSTEVAQWLHRTAAALLKYSDLLREPEIADRDRRRLMDELGETFSDYRQQVYANGFSGKTTSRLAEILPFLRLTLVYVDHSIRANRRSDGMYHSYNLLRIQSSGDVSISRLYEMLEGQVAVLSSGAIDTDEVVQLLHALLASRMYRPDQASLMLYPDRQLPSFLDRNRLTDEQVLSIPLLRRLTESGDTSIIARDQSGCFRFNSSFRNTRDLSVALEKFDAGNRDAVLNIYEQVFGHHHFTGRSAAMFAYEGVGSVYWHMVAKLLLATQECFVHADRQRLSWETLHALAQLYYRVREGLGYNKSAKHYGAFPTDPYSHTPINGGARQPGMTGQVKEEILTRFGELGVRVEQGRVIFRPTLLRRREFLSKPTQWNYFAIDSQQRTIQLDEFSLGFTYCQVPVIYHLTSDPPRVIILSSDGTAGEFAGNQLDTGTSASLFQRDQKIRRIDVAFPNSMIRLD